MRAIQVLNAATPGAIDNSAVPLNLRRRSAPRSIHDIRNLRCSANFACQQPHESITLSVHASQLCRVSYFAALLALVFLRRRILWRPMTFPATRPFRCFSNPRGNHLNILVRVPLKTMRDVEFPSADRAIWILTMWTRRCEKRATLWVSDFIDVYEGDDALAEAAHCRDAPLSRVRSFIRLLRPGARARHRPEALE